jgi:hypothetical protein
MSAPINPDFLRAACVASLLLIAGCAQPAPAPAPVLGCPGGPPATAEAPPPVPPISASRQVLRPAHWEWVAGSYVFEAARWVPYEGYLSPQWLPGHWRHGDSGCDWVPGHFLR